MGAMKFLYLFPLLCVCFVKVNGQRSIELQDTIKLTGMLIYDSIKDECYFTTNLINTEGIKKSKIKKLIRNNDYVYIDRAEIISSVWRKERIRINFCVSENTTQYTIRGENLLYDRYYLIPIIDDWFITLNVDRKRKGITLKCW